MSKLGCWALWASLFVFLSLSFGNQTSRSGDGYVSSQSAENISRLRQKRLDNEASRMMQLYLIKHRSIRSTNTTTNNTGKVRQYQNTTLKPLFIPPEGKTYTAPPLHTDSEFILTPAIPKLETNCPDGVYSCSNKCQDKTAYFRFSSLLQQHTVYDCYCDKACDDVFLDCCSNYEKSCSISSKSKEMDEFYKHKSSWRCIAFKVVFTEGCFGPRGSWMIARCPTTWTIDDVKTKCHNPASSLDAQSLQLYLPVVGLTDLLTYRNKYCALCNNVSTYDFWTLIFNKEAIPPPYYTPDDFGEFIAKNYQHLIGVRPKEDQRIRWCTYPDVISSCGNTTTEQDLKNCHHGTVGLVKEAGSNIFKNKACALCNGYQFTCGVAERKVGSSCINIDGSAISRAISLRDFGVSTTTASCPKNEVYDTFLQKCRQIYVINILNAGPVDKYQVIWSIPKKDKTGVFFPGNEINKAISTYYRVNESQINNVKFESSFLVDNPEIYITFEIQLTQAQSLNLASDVNLNGTSNDTITLRRLFRFREAFQLHVNRWVTLTIYRQQVRQLNCTRPHVYEIKEFVFLDDLRIRILSTGAIYEQFEYYMNSSIKNSSVTVCLKIVSSQCNGSYIKLNSSEFHFTDNLTLVYNTLAYKFGDYVYDQGLVFICVNFGKDYTTTIRKSEPTDLALVILTWIGFILSIIGLLILFITYVLFKDLRTLPGKNLMNLCLSLCLAEILWLIGSTLDAYPTTCTVVAVANHYFFLVYFTASSVIAFHTCLIFGRKINFRRSSSGGNKVFIIYSLIAWGVPGLFLLIFALLDHYDVFIIDYGKSVVCWLGTKESRIFLFILPFGILLLFNLILFVLVAIRLHDNQRSSAQALGEEARKHETHNVKICLKLSTLMGFSWLFGLLQIAVETETDAFPYLFIIFVSFQGLFICAAFLFQRKCYKLYSTLLSKSLSSSKASGHGEQRSSSNNTKKTTSGVKDTKL